MSMHWRIAVLTGLVCALAGCSDDDPTGPTPEQITGDWNATRVEYTSVPPGTTVELIALGGAATLRLDPGGTFHYVVTAAGEAPDTVDGTWRLDGDEIEMTPAGMPFSWQFSVAISSGTLGLDGGSVEYDFDDDGTPDQARLALQFVR